MNASPQYPAPDRQITNDDLLAALLPDTPAGAQTTTLPPAAQPTLDVAALLELARRQGALEATVKAQAPAVPAEDKVSSGPVVPRWAVGAAVAAVGIGAGGLLLGVALDLLATGVAAVAAGLTAAAPMLILGVVLVAALLSRRSPAPTVEITQTITQTITGGKR